ncbi:dolichyldiphosphatase [Podospora conica]|nr:dolichyldiphosphatase [Schizothecium conicum]
MASDVTPLASLSLTHVRYNPSDPLSLLAATLSLLPQALIISYTTLLLSTREAEVLLLLAGQLACEALNFVLKRLIRQDRPRHIHADTTKGYGMPSSHAQFVSFWAVSVVLFLLVRHRGATPLWMRAGVGAAAVGVAAAVAWSRVYLGYHTGWQVLAGCVAGVGCGVGWFGVVGVVRGRGWLGWALELPVVRWFRVRDLVVDEDVSLAGWEKWEGRREAERLRREAGERRKGE